MLAGTLEIQMLAQLARLQKDMQDAKQMVGGTMQSIEHAVGSAKSALAAFGLGLSAAGLLRFAQQAIQAQDEMVKLSQKVGIGVGELSQFAYAADLSGVSSQGLTAGMKGLAQRMLEANDTTSKASKIFAALGVSVGGPASAAIEDIADAFAQLPDGTTKSALAVEIFGKSGMDMIPMLNQGAAGIRALREEADKLGLTMDAEAAKAAEAFNDNMAAVGATSKALGVTFVNAVAPAILEVSKVMKQATIDGGLLHGVLEGLREGWSQAFLGDPAKNRIAELRKELALLEPMLQEAPGLASRVEELNRELSGLLSFQDLGQGSKPAASTGSAGSELEKRLRGLFSGAERASEDWQRHEEQLRKLDIQGWVRYVDVTTQEYEDGLRAQAKLAEDYYRDQDDLRQIELDGQEWLAKNVVKIVEEEEKQVRAIREANLLSMWDELSSRGADFFTDLVTNGREAFHNLGQSLKQWGRELVALFAKRWILQLGAAMTGSTALGAAAATTGNGSLAGGFLNGFSGIGSILPGGEIGTAVGNFASMGASMFGAGGSLASTIGSVASFLPAIGAAVSVAAMLYSAFNDGPENPNFRWFQGTGGQGAFGGISSSGNYNFDASGLMGYVGGLDARFARILGPEGSASVTGALAGYTNAGLRMDGLQPAQFAFPEGTDREAAEQLAKELLQSRYGTIFAAIDSGIAEQIRAFSGTSSELQAFIETALGVVEGLSGLGVNGLDVGTLQLMQREGEDLGATFNRVAGQWSNFTQLFTTEAERLTAAQDLVSSTFANLGIAIPASKDEFEALVRGLDLSTDSGRRLFQALMDVAPAFAAVEDAAASMMDSFYQVMGQLQGPGYTANVTQGLLQQATQQFMGLNSWTQGMDWSTVASALSNITPDDFSAYGAYGNGSQQLILDILNYQAQLNQAGTQTATFTDSVGGAATAISNMTNAIHQARNGIREWLDRILFSDTSPLTPQERLDAAQQAYVENLIKAQAGDAGALAAYTGLADTYLREAQSYWASSPEYRAIFESVTGQAGRLAGLSDARPVNKGDADRNTERIVDGLERVRNEIRDLGDGTIALNRTTERVVKAVDTLGKAQSQAIQRQTRELTTPLGV